MSGTTKMRGCKIQVLKESEDEEMKKEDRRKEDRTMTEIF